MNDPRAEPGPSRGQQEYDAYLGRFRQSVFWRPRTPVWAFDAPGEEPPPAPHWFFVLNYPRTGSSVLGRLLNSHPQVYCGLEEHILPLFMTVLGSEVFIAPQLKHAVRYQKALDLTPLRLRHLMEAWRRGVSDRPAFGDKGDMYYRHFGPACSAVFPGCKLLLTVRRPLDTLSSYMRQPFAAFMYRLHPEREDFYGFVRAQARGLLTQNHFWRDHAQSVVFEQLATREGFEETFQRVLRHLEVDPVAFDWEAGWRQCAHRKAVDRWRDDEQITGFLAWLRRADPVLHEVLASGEPFLPKGLPSGWDAGDTEMT